MEDDDEYEKDASLYGILTQRFGGFRFGPLVFSFVFFDVSFGFGFALLVLAFVVVGCLGYFSGCLVFWLARCLRLGVVLGWRFAGVPVILLIFISFQKLIKKILPIKKKKNVVT